MRAMADHAEEFRSHGATVLALTPELPEFSGNMVEENEVPFPVLTDLNLEVAERYGLVFDLGIITDLYESFAELSKKNGEEAKSKLPISATYIIDSSGMIRYAFLEPDYRKRPEPSDLVKELEALVE